MTTTKAYVRTDEHGVFRIGQTRVSLDSVVYAFERGHSAETIQQQYPALGLEEVYGAIAFYLANREAVRQYLERQEQVWDERRQQAEQNPSPVVERLRALRAASREDAMSRPRFLTDQDFNEHIIRGVERRSPDTVFLRVREIGLEDRTDAELLEYAAAEQWIVLSHDVNTMSAAALVRLTAGRELSGLLLVHQQSAIASIIDDLIRIGRRVKRKNG